jgi:putative hydrolase of the HAD superfamily
MGTRAVVFDFGNVIAFFSHRRSAEQVARHTDMAPEAVEAYLYGGRLMEDYETGRITTPVFIGTARQTCRLRCTDEEFDVAYSDMFWPNDPVCALVPRLAGRWRLLLVSNTNDLHHRWFHRHFAETLGYFDALVLSHEVGARKPDRRIFEEARRRAGCAAEECLFIDDLPTNVEGARACGWRGLVYRPGDGLARELAALGVVA